MDTDAMELYGEALRDLFNGDLSTRITVHRDDGLTDPMPMAAFFCKPADFSILEQTALKLCRGDVLDIGAGAGRHSLALQERGLSVWAIDVSPQAVAIMRERGVQQVRCIDVFELDGRRFDTLLMLMHGIGLVRDLPGLDRFLRHVHKLIKPGGQIVLDSLDVRCTEDPRHLAYQETNRRTGHYFGEIRMQFEYQGRTGPVFSWLHVDPQTLTTHAQEAGWRCQVICQEENGDYLTQLVPAGAMPNPYHIGENSS